VKITARTNFTPTLTFDTAAPAKSAGSSLLKIVKPSVDVELFKGSAPAHLAPYGEPTGWGVFFVYGFAGLAAYGAFQILKGAYHVLVRR
jgi:hypothetical protein